MFIDPEAMIAAAAKIGRDWGHAGYAITGVKSAPYRGVLIEVVAGDGSRFHIGATRYGQTTHHEDAAIAAESLAKLAESERG